MLLTNWKEREFLIEATKLNLEGVAECRFFLQGVKNLRYFSKLEKNDFSALNLKTGK